MRIQYLAGIVDGEGHFYRPNHKNGRGERHPSSRLVVVNTHVPLIQALKSQFGGNISPVNLRHGSLGSKPCYRWCLAGKKCEELARRLRPHLIVKTEQVRRVLDY